MATATGWSGLNNYIFTGGYSGVQQFTPQERALNRLLNKGRGGRRLRQVLVALTGSAVGQSKVLTNYRIQHPADVSGMGLSLGGLRTVEAVNYQSGVTSAGDLTRIDDRMTRKVKPAYVRDRSITNNGMFNRNKA